MQAYTSGQGYIACISAQKISLYFNHCILIILLCCFFSGACISLMHVFSRTKAKQMRFSMG